MAETPNRPDSDRRSDSTAPPAEVAALREREPEIERVGSALWLARKGAGRAVLIQGPPGIGKTSLLGVARHLAAAGGFHVLEARLDALGVDIPNAVPRALFAGLLDRPESSAERLAGAARFAEPVLREEAPPAAPARGQKTSYVDMHGLYWLLVNLSSERPVCLLIDDVHSADSQSLEWLLYAVRRLESLPVAVVLTVRSNDRPSSVAFVERLRSNDLVTVVQPRPLSEAGLADMLLDHVDPELAAELAAEAHRLSGGIPLLVDSLVSEIDTHVANGGAVTAEALGTMVSPQVSEFAASRIQSLSAPAASVIRAVAVLGNQCTLPRLAWLCGIAAADAEPLGEDLLAKGLLASMDPPRLAHPLLRQALLEDLPPDDVAKLHAAAARLLARSGGPSSAVGAHLLRTAPSGDAWVAETLAATARSSHAEGANELAAQLLERALEEPPSAELLPALLLDLGTVRSTLGDPRAIGDLQRADELARDDQGRAQVALALSRTLEMSGRPAEAAEHLAAVSRAIEASEPDWARELDAQVLFSASLNADLHDAMAERLLSARAITDDGPSPAERRILSFAAHDVALGAGTAQEAVELAHRALGHGELLSHETADSLTYFCAASALLHAGALADGYRACSEAITEARSRGSHRGYAMASTFRAMANIAMGRTREAESDANNALSFRDQDFAVLQPVAAGYLIEALMERGDLDGAAEAAAVVADLGPLEDLIVVQPLLSARGRLALAQGRIEDARTQLARLQEIQARWRTRNVCSAPWRGELAQILAPEVPSEAARLLDEGCEIAEAFGDSRGVARSLRFRLQVLGGDASELEAAVHALREGDARLELAYSLRELGRSAARDGRKKDAKSWLLEALDAAHRCGADRLEAEVRETLVSIGSRPRRALLTGVEALTARELSIAEMVAQGMSNREIAEAAFLTENTVEVHLTRVYKKLGIQARSLVAQALAAPDWTADQRRLELDSAMPLI